MSSTCGLNACAHLTTNDPAVFDGVTPIPDCVVVKPLALSLTVIDCMRSLELGTTDCSDGIREAAVVELDGHHYALIVDLVEDVVEALSDPTPVRAAMGAGWERVSQGMVETEQGPLLLVDVAALIAGAETKAAA